jgi:hypothetical protein
VPPRTNVRAASSAGCLSRWLPVSLAACLAGSLSASLPASPNVRLPATRTPRIAAPALRPPQQAHRWRIAVVMATVTAPSMLHASGACHRQRPAPRRHGLVLVCLCCAMAGWFRSWFAAASQPLNARRAARQGDECDLGAVRCDPLPLSRRVRPGGRSYRHQGRRDPGNRAFAAALLRLVRLVGAWPESIWRRELPPRILALAKDRRPSPRMPRGDRRPRESGRPAQATELCRFARR